MQAPRSFRTQVSDVIMRKAETKQFNIGIENIQLYHQLGQSLVTTTSITDLFNPWARITKGTSRNQRIGDRITLLL